MDNTLWFTLNANTAPYYFGVKLKVKEFPEVMFVVILSEYNGDYVVQVADDLGVHSTTWTALNSTFALYEEENAALSIPEGCSGIAHIGGEYPVYADGRSWTTPVGSPTTQPTTCCSKSDIIPSAIDGKLWCRNCGYKPSTRDRSNP